MKFDKLRLVGFKSFVEPTDFEIRPGLTGIVGPNGCGKSNLLESLRWVMGATSAKALRAGGMEDVIFSGTKDRPERNWAEVMLTLNNSDRTLPSEYNDMETLEISRRVTKKQEGATSDYKINGKGVRARDVQLLFADASTGANSPALVRQGQISELINAKPQNRRRLLEEAAGITGLHSRRHEAELRLRAAETNLARLDDVTGELETQRHALAKQARQATRYRNLSGHIRRAEAMTAYLRWLEASTALEESKAALAQINQLVEETARVAATATASQTKGHEILDPLRHKEAEEAAALHRLNVEQENLEAEIDRATAEAARLEREVERLGSDATREQELGRDATGAIEALSSEEQGLRAREQAEASRLAEAASQMASTSDALSDIEARHDRQTADAAEQDADRRALTNSLAEAARRFEKLVRDLTGLKQEREGFVLSGEEEAQLSTATALVSETKDALASAEQSATRTEETKRQHASREEALRSPKQRAAQSLAELKAEADAIRRMLAAGQSEDFPALIEEVTVEAGYENALAAALGDDLSAALSDEAAAFWSGIGASDIDKKALPPEAEKLSEFVQAPSALARRLDMIGVVDAAQGDRLHGELAPGQRLVSIDGDLWRWDGYVARADAKTAAAIRLEQRNRLDGLELDIQGAEDRLSASTKEYETAQSDLNAANEKELETRSALKQARQAEGQAVQSLASLERQHQHANTRLAALDEAINRLSQDEDETKDSVSLAETTLAALPDASLLRQAIESTRETLLNARAEASEARAGHNDLAREAEMRATRLEEIARERGVWKSRGETATTRIDEINTRLAENQAALEIAIKAPEAVATKRTALFEQIEIAESRRRAAADKLAEAMLMAGDADTALKAADAEAVSARENRARIEAQLDAAKQRVEEATSLSREACDAEPEQLLEITEHKQDKPMPERFEIERKLEKLKRERENLGGVNLRADTEMEEIDARLIEISTEHEDCEAAIRKLRAAIGSLNREGRQKLLDAFVTVNANFQKLFIELFGGGSAELRLIDSDDPLEAGLEVFASPPGKKLSSMSLMSGGEQALTATALIFAVFMANPAPVCVLDEVDAPLDDANTERFCNMLERMAEDTDTRFIIITHHALTMSRMNRLYGVTMIERGISQLVSVDLNAAEDLVAAE